MPKPAFSYRIVNANTDEPDEPVTGFFTAPQAEKAAREDVLTVRKAAPHLDLTYRLYHNEIELNPSPKGQGFSPTPPTGQ